MNEILPLKNKALRNLNILRYKNLQSPAEEAHLDFQRRQADSQDPVLQKAWFHSMNNAFEEIDDVLKVVPQTSRIHFLDLGCCPGGFTSYILSKNSKAYGTGISLPVENGGHACLLNEDHLKRFKLYWADLTRFQLGAVLINDPSLQSLPIVPQSFDLVLIDGHPLRPSTNGSHHHLPASFYLLSDRLLISQLIIGLAAAASGSTIIVKASKPERIITSQLMFLFDLLCVDVRTWKPVCIHGTRSTFYIVGKGFGYGRFAYRKEQILADLMDLWVQLSYYGGKGRRLFPDDLDFIADRAVLKGPYAPRLQQLSQHIWTAQSQCLEGWQNAKAEGF
ncbi:FtsJ domain-containing protein [Mycena indigotica]|uniref:FtsJ domain-containing protein n=1 Tax=Mycena indigotica TaxID=2126181 RepID=A0A8H6SGQ5_9AGAR|nr:FtsJ domain-containing protein [Mycena indigotica]KAF7299248.1 FtsJ domain-containing protein [Mycena indigotica]